MKARMLAGIIILFITLGVVSNNTIARSQNIEDDLQTNSTINDIGFPFGPCESWYVYQGYYSNHSHSTSYAFDLVTHHATERIRTAGMRLYAPATGVFRVFPEGNEHTVEIRLDDGSLVYLVHLMNVPPISNGTRIGKGTFVGEVANTMPGGVNHLHFSVFRNSRTVPLNFGSWTYPAGTPTSPVPSTGNGQWSGTRINSPCGTPYQATYVSQTYSSEMYAGSTQVVQVQVKNTGTRTWDGLTHIAISPRDTSSPFYDPATWVSNNRIQAAGSIAPGQTKTFQFVLRAPTTLGDYTVRFGFVQEGVAWFNEGSIWFNIKVRRPTVGEGSSRQQAFIDAYTSQGGSEQLGYPLTNAYWWGNSQDERSFVIQELSGQNGANDVYIIHDEKRDNPINSTPAYIIRGDILQYYKNLGGWQSWLGPPTSHQLYPDSNHAQSNFRNGYIRITNSPYKIEAIPWDAPDGRWRASYHNGHNLNSYPTWVQNESTIHYELMNSAPGEGNWGVFNDNFTVRYNGRFTFMEGNYTFIGSADDLIRVWIDGNLIIDKTLGEQRVTRWMTAGEHDIRVEYFEFGGYASYHFSWDYDAPNCTITIQEGNVYTGQRNVQLRVNVNNASQMLISNDGGFGDAEWQPYQSTFSWTLNDPGARIATLLTYAQFRDSSGNLLCGGNLIDDIIYDPLAPDLTATFQSVGTNSTSPYLILSAEDQAGGSGVYQMQLSSTSSFPQTEWEPFKQIVAIDNTPGSVYYIRVRDSVGNISHPVQVSIPYRTLLPVMR